MDYRREIDGLRTVAIVPVVLFHAGLPHVSGGYVGVDVFFVISGYLITAGLISDLCHDRWSILRFYERRVRRILPALLFVLFACLPFAWMWMRPEALSDFGEYIAATVLFLANLQAMNQIGYFAPSAETQPLLHMWSLAVEEQYYLLFPPFLALLWRSGASRRALWGVAILCLLSFCLADWGTRSQPEKAYFFTLARFWELGVGSLCALLLQDRPLRPNTAASVAGLGLILGAVFFYDATTPFPGVFALAPVLGAALIILFCGPGTGAGRILSTRPMVAVGLVSYSAYLWHQPLFAFARIRAAEEPQPWLMLALAALTFVLAALSWRYVEQPFRRRPTPVLAARARIFGAAAALGATLIAVGAAFSLQEGFPDRLTARYAGDVGHAAFFAGIAATSYPCTPPAIAAAAERWNGYVRCYQSMPEKPITVLLFGDSHAEHLFPGLAAQLPNENVGYYIFTPSPPFAGNPAVDPIFREIARNRSLTDIVLAMRWTDRTSDFGSDEAFAAALRKTLDRLGQAGAQVVLVDSVPVFAIGADVCKFVLPNAQPPSCTRPLQDVMAERATYLPALVRVAAERNLPLVSLPDVFCDASTCAMQRGGTMLYRDTNHLTLAGSRLAGAAVAHALRPRQ